MPGIPIRRTLFIITCFSLAAVPWLYQFATHVSSQLTSEGQQFRTLSPSGKLILNASNGRPAIAPLTMNFVRTPDSSGPDGKGRYLVAVNSGWGIQDDSNGKDNQSISVIDLNAKPDPVVIQNVYFRSPQSANFGLVFDPKTQTDGKYRFYVSGGFENKVWMMSYDPNGKWPITPKNELDKALDAPFINVSGFAQYAPSPNYNDNVASVYPTGIALGPNGQTLYTANNLDDSLGIVSDLRDTRRLERISLLRTNSGQFVYPYDVKLLSKGTSVSKIYVSLWGDGSIAVVNPSLRNRVTNIKVERHPTLMVLNRSQTRLYVVNSDADSVSVIDTATDHVIEKIDVRLNESLKNGTTPEGLALSENEQTLFVTNAHANVGAVVQLEKTPTPKMHSKLLGFIPTGNYPSAIAVVGDRLIVANGKGLGMENSSNIPNQSGMYPNMPNKNFPGDHYNKRGMHIGNLVEGNMSVVTIPDEKQLYAFTQQAMRNNGILGEKKNIFPAGKAPFKHVIYVIRENRSYDQVFGDVSNSGDGTRADGDPSVAIFGSGTTARSPSGQAQNITPNAHALAMRFGLLDRFFVNAEASPDGHNWSTAAFSNDYVDKAFRWQYADRGRTYDYEGFNRLPSFEPPSNQPPVALPSVFELPVKGTDIANYLKRYVPYLQGARDIAEPETLYLWDAARRGGLTYRNYGEYVATVSEADVRAVNDQKAKRYPDISPTVTAFATKKSLEGHFSTTLRNYDLDTPDLMTTDSYKAARESAGGIDPVIASDSPDPRFRGTSRFGEWRREFRQHVSDLQSGRGDHLPNLSIVRFSNDHTAGLHRGTPTPQFFVAENDYALGRLIEEVSNSPYWADTAIFVVEDDAQDGPDHVDGHRSPALVISAYNRQGALVHEFHNTVSLIRTMEICLRIAPMNFLDANATPIDIFTDRPDLRPFKAELPSVSLDNLFPSETLSTTGAYYFRLTDKQDLSHADMANAQELNSIIWFSVRGNAEMPGVARLPAFNLMTRGIRPDNMEADADD